MDNGSQNEMTIERLRHGGFVVRTADRTPGTWNAPVFASSSIDDALKFIRDAINPVLSVQSGSAT